MNSIEAGHPQGQRFVVKMIMAILSQRTVICSGGKMPTEIRYQFEEMVRQVLCLLGWLLPPDRGNEGQY